MAGLVVLRDTLRNAAYAGVDGASWLVTRLKNGDLIASGTTAADATASPALHGAIRAEETDLSEPYPGPIRLTAEDPGSGAQRVALSNSVGIVGSWRSIDVPRGWRGLGGGVVPGAGGELAAAVSGGSMVVTIAGGTAIVACGQDALVYAVPAPQNITVPTPHATLPRIDSVAIRFFGPGHAEEGRASLVVLGGTANAVPNPPAPAIGVGNVWEFTLWDVRLDAGASVIALGKLTDKRDWIMIPPAPRSPGDLFVIGTDHKLIRLPIGTVGQALFVGPGAVETDPPRPGWGQIDPADIVGAIPAIRIGAGTVDDTELGYLNGVTSALQTQIDGKMANDVELSALAGLVSAADTMPYFTGVGAAAVTALTAFARSLLDDLDAAAMRATLGIAAGSYQPLDDQLTALAALVPVADRLPYFTSATAAALATLTAASRTLLANATVAAWQAGLSLEPGVDVQAFDPDLAQIAALTGSGFPARSSGVGWALRQMLAGDGITIANSTGLAGNPVITKESVSTYWDEAYRDASAIGTRNITSTSGIDGLNVTASFVLPNNGYMYDLIAQSWAQVNAPSGDWIYLTAAIDAGSGTYSPGTYVGNGTVGGERTLLGSKRTNVVGSGQTVNARCYGKVGGGTGSFGTGGITLMAIPRI